MDLEKNWEKALKYTEIIRPRIQPLSAFETTSVPYIFLSESLGGSGNCIVRKGRVLVERPSLLLPANYPQLQGFEFDAGQRGEADDFMNFLLVRGIKFPSLLYNNTTYSLSIYEGKLKDACDHYLGKMEREENTHSGLVLGKEDCWQFSVLIFTAGQVLRSAESDITRLLEQYRKKEKGGG